MLFVTGHEGPKRFALPVQRKIYFCKEILIQFQILVSIMFQLLFKSCNIPGSVFNVKQNTQPVYRLKWQGASLIYLFFNYSLGQRTI